MFACGALLATTFFLILPESLALIQADFLGDGHDGHNHRELQEEDDHSGEGAATWRFGTAILGGFLIPVVSHVLFPHQELHDHPFHHQGKANDENTTLDDAVTPPPEQSNTDGKQSSSGSTESPINNDANSEKLDDNLSSDEEKQTKANDKSESRTCGVSITNPSLVASIFLGDFFHNFADGIFIGTAFLLCERSLAITITAATIWHELAQEVADYFLLVHHCGMTRCSALTLNFVCGLSIMLGGLLVLAIDLPSSAIGVILCIGAGVYVHVAIADCLATAKKHEKGRKHKLFGILAFMCGVFPIGLVLLNHQHCGGH
jgi:zinc transporter ZupT